MIFFKAWRNADPIEMGTIQDKRLATERDSASLLPKKISSRDSIVPEFPRDFLAEQTKSVNAFVAMRGSPQQASVIANAQQQFSAPAAADDDEGSDRSGSPERRGKMVVFSPRSWGFVRSFSLKNVNA